MLPTIDLMSLKINYLDLPWPTFQGHNAKTRYNDNFRIHAPIYTIFEVIYTTIALDELEDEWTWPIFDLLFQVAMQNLFGVITSDFIHWYTHNFTQSCIPP